MTAEETIATCERLIESGSQEQALLLLEEASSEDTA
jgi:hypothetical protein